MGITNFKIYVRLASDSYHNYISYQEEVTVYGQPWKYECSDDSNLVLTKEQYSAIVSTAEWQPEERLMVINSNFQRLKKTLMSRIYLIFNSPLLMEY